MSTTPSDAGSLVGPTPGSVAAWTHAGDAAHSAAPPTERYVAGGELGRGGMGVVRAATDVWLDREVAVKRARADLPAALRERMMHEARITARLVHPSIPPIYEVAAVAGAVGYAHDRGVVHRDLKPANVLLGAHEEVWVLDWGVALDLSAPDACVVGTAGYRAPEQARDGGVGPPADVYALGVVLREVLHASREAHP